MNAIHSITKPTCPRCEYASPIRYGFVLGRQRWLCRDCSYQFTVERLMFKPLDVKQKAANLYEEGQSSNRIGKKLGLSATTVLLWARLLTPAGGRIHQMKPRLALSSELHAEWHRLNREEAEHRRFLAQCP
jgi:transposase-like protein